MPPGCCGKPVPGRLVEMVMSQEEQGALMDKMMFLDDTGLHTSSQRKGDHVAVGGQALPGTLSNHSAPQFDGSSLAQQEARQNLKRALDLPTFRQMREAQEAQRDRFVAWSARIRQECSQDYRERKEAMACHHEHQIEELSSKVGSFPLFCGSIH